MPVRQSRRTGGPDCKCRRLAGEVRWSRHLPHCRVAHNATALLHGQHGADVDRPPTFLHARLDHRGPFSTRRDLSDAVEQHLAVVDSRLTAPGVLQIPVRSVAVVNGVLATTRQKSNLHLEEKSRHKRGSIRATRQAQLLGEPLDNHSVVSRSCRPDAEPMLSQRAPSVILTPEPSPAQRDGQERSPGSRRQRSWHWRQRSWHWRQPSRHITANPSGNQLSPPGTLFAFRPDMRLPLRLPHRAAVFCIIVGFSAGCDGPVTAPASFASPTLEFRPIAAACAHPEQCVTGACSAVDTEAICGVCLERRTLGETCGGSLETCGPTAECKDGKCVTTRRAEGETCRALTRGDPEAEALYCDDDLYCASAQGELLVGGQAGACAPRAALGATCDFARGGCRGVLHCEDGVCVEPRLGQLDESCDERDCASGLFCNQDTICKPATLPLGADCGSTATACEEGTFCSLLDPDGGGQAPFPQVCKAPSVAGEPCATGICAEGLVCSATLDFICAPRGGEGVKCGHSTECAEGFECRGNECTPACD